MGENFEFRTSEYSIHKEALKTQRPNSRANRLLLTKSVTTLMLLHSWSTCSIVFSNRFFLSSENTTRCLKNENPVVQDTLKMKGNNYSNEKSHVWKRRELFCVKGEWRLYFIVQLEKSPLNWWIAAYFNCLCKIAKLYSRALCHGYCMSMILYSTGLFRL